MIRIRNLKKTFSTDFSLEISALDICDGDRVALIGMNGSGKSTLLRILAGQLSPDAGKISCDVPKAARGYQPQAPYAFRGTAAENVRIALRREQETADVVRACGLEGLLDKKMTALSGGEKQRVFLARMLAGGYRLLLLDEPLSAADLQTGASLSALLRETCESSGTTLVFSTHLPQQAFEIATKILLLDHGKIAEAGSVEEMRAPKSDFGKLFFAQWRV